MAQPIDTAFVTQFQTEIYEALQNPGDVLENRGRVYTFQEGERMRFPKIGAFGAPGQKLPNGEIPTYDVARSFVEVVPYDRYHGTWLDRIATLKTNTDQRGALVRGIQKAMARQNDDDALVALMTSANANNSLAGADTFSSDTVPRQVLEQFGKAEAMDSGERHALVTWAAWNALLALNSFVNSQFGGNTQLTSEGVMPKMYFGFNYVPYSRLRTVTGQSFRANIFMAQNALAIGILMNTVTEIEWHQKNQAWLISTAGARNAVLLDDTPVILRGYAA